MSVDSPPAAGAHVARTPPGECVLAETVRWLYVRLRAKAVGLLIRRRGPPWRS